MQREITEQIILNFVERHGLYLVPLHSITNDGICTCKNVKCSSPGKHPLFKTSWKKVATKDVTKIKTWINKYEHLNWGILTGKKSLNEKFLTVIDVDKKDHEILKQLPTTFSYTTGNGYHFWYWASQALSNSVSQIGKNVDLRGKNGYVVIPPSKHVSGISYKLYDKSEEIADLPEFIQETTITPKPTEVKKEKKSEICRKPFNAVYTRKSVKEIRRAIRLNGRIKNGTRNCTIHRLLSSDRSKGFEKDALVTRAMSYREKCQNKETVLVSEINNIVNSVLKYPPYNNMGKKFRRQVLLTELDEKFFKAIKPSNIIETSLNEILFTREKYLDNYGYKQLLAQYSNQEWAEHFKNLGLSKKRKSSGNVWCCYIDHSML